MSLSLPGVIAPQVSHSQTPAASSFTEMVREHPEAARAAQQFEAVFIKQLMNTVEKMSSMTGKGSETQSSIVGSMMTGAFSEQMSAAGGIGLSEVILRAMIAAMPEEPTSNAARSSAETSAQAPSPAPEST
jgi:Rod binding domain-containing protein